MKTMMKSILCSMALGATLLSPTVNAQTVTELYNQGVSLRSNSEMASEYDYGAGSNLSETLATQNKNMSAERQAQLDRRARTNANANYNSANMKRQGAAAFDDLKNSRDKRRALQSIANNAMQ